MPRQLIKKHEQLSFALLAFIFSFSVALDLSRIQDKP